MEDPNAWWKFAIKSALIDVRKRRSQWKWDVIQQRADDRKVYLDLYAKKLEKNLDEDDQKVLSALDHKLKFEDILL